MTNTSAHRGFWQKLDKVSRRTLLYVSTIAAVVALWRMLSPPIMLIIAIWYAGTGAVELFWLATRPARTTFTLGHFLNGCILLTLVFGFCAQLIMLIHRAGRPGGVGQSQRLDALILAVLGVAAYEWAIMTMGAFVKTVIAGSTEDDAVAIRAGES